MDQPQLPFLVVRLSSIGDIVHALPAVSALARAHPQREIHWAVEARYAYLLDGNPHVARRICLDTLGGRARPLSGNKIQNAAGAWHELRASLYEAVIDFQGLIKSALVARIARTRKRVGFARGSVREPLASLFYSEAVSAEGRRHVIEKNIALAERLGASAVAWEFPLPRSEESERKVAGELQRRQISDFIIVNPGGGWKAKRWAPSNYARLIRALAGALSDQILVTGSASEAPVIQTILGEAASANAGYFPSTLIEYIELARRARLFIGGDTGPLHLAAALATPIVALYNSSDRLNTPERNGPFNPSDITLTAERPFAQDSEHSGYLEGISVERVVESVRERLKRANG